MLVRADKGFDPVEVAARQVKREKAAKAAAAAGVAVPARRKQQVPGHADMQDTKRPCALA
ncbi:MAG: hypothetical protein ACPIOQ_17315 [Promethearchaeia archaeon]